MDGDEAVSSGTMEVQLAATGDPDFDDHFLVTLDELKVGAAIRWAITIGDTHISLHGLPLSIGGGAGQAQPQGRQCSSHPALQRPNQLQGL